MIEQAQKDGVSLIIDYAGKRTWRPGRGWRSDPKLIPTYKHLHIEHDGYVGKASGKQSARPTGQGIKIPKPLTWKDIFGGKKK